MTIKPPLNVFECLMILGTVSFVLGVGYVMFTGVQESIQRKDAAIAAAKRDGAGQVSITYDGYTNIRTVRHDGHLFVTYGGDFIIHHPSCPCLGRSVKVEGPGQGKR